MHQLRGLVFDHRLFAGALLALALALRLTMPAGYMPDFADGRMIVSVCTGMGPASMVVSIPGLAQKPTGGDEHRQQAEQPCAFAGLATPSLAAVDPTLLAGAIAFVLERGNDRARTGPISQAPPYLRPPLRGPPTVG